MCPASVDVVESVAGPLKFIGHAYAHGNVEIPAGFFAALAKTGEIGSTKELIPEAGDAAANPAKYIQDGKSGDVDFPFGQIKPIATVGEYTMKGEDGYFVVGVPDGQGAYLVDDDTLRFVFQSESYGTISGGESYPWFVNDGAASFTGSHVQYVDYERSMLPSFMSDAHKAVSARSSAEMMVKKAGNVIKRAYNLKGEPVMARNTTGPTLMGAHFSNTDANGEWALATDLPTDADWIMQSLCSAHLALRHQWGNGLGVEDTLFMTNEEWIRYTDTPFVGLSAHAINLATGEDYAVGAFTNSGFEKIVEINSGHPDWVAFVPQGYNGDFGTITSTIARRNALGLRDDGNPYVFPRDVVPTRLYLGKKGYNEKGEPATDFLSRNGLRYGQLYGFAVPTSELDRDAWHKEAGRTNGDALAGSFYPIDWRWDGVVRNFEHDGAWHWQNNPKGTTGDVKFWNSAGKNAGGCKTEQIGRAHV